MKPERSDWLPFESLVGMVRLVLLVEWDPMGVLGHAGAMGEYDSYAPAIADLLLTGASRENLIADLDGIEKGEMQNRGNRAAAGETADKLLSVLITPTLAHLHFVDDSEAAELPPGFDKKAATVKFNSLVAALEQRLGCKLEQEHSIEDASYHGAAFLPPQVLLEGWKDYAVSVRASNFGNLATVYEEGTVVQLPVMKILIETLREFGYDYIPSNVLHLRYMGNNLYIHEGYSWGQRFFDYL